MSVRKDIIISIIIISATSCIAWATQCDGDSRAAMLVCLFV